MKVVVIGLGSMGKRRGRLIKELFPECEVSGIDGRKDRRKEAERLLGIETYESLKDFSGDCDCAFVCTSPLSHRQIINNCLKNGWHVFTELNLVDDGYDENIKLAEKEKLKLFLSSTFLYREEIQYIRQKIDIRKRYNYIYHIGQYLPDWHPWENYRDFFVGDKRTNGCREIMAIELPWIEDVFGDIEKVNVQCDKLTNLNINYNDNYIIQLTHINGNKGVLVVDVVSPCAVRKMELYREGVYISWGGTPDSLYEFNSASSSLERVLLSEKAEHMEGYRSFVVENAYRNEIREFFDVVQSGKNPRYGFAQDQKILHLIDTIGA